MSMLLCLCEENIATLKKILFSTFEHLGKEDFEEFKWHLQQKVLGFEGIPKSRLEDACRTQTVDHMFLNYCINTIKVTRNVLKEMNQNLLEEKLSEITSEPTARHRGLHTTGSKGPINASWVVGEGEEHEILTQCQGNLKFNLKKKIEKSKKR
ncbi:Pyrin, partial [Dissostichus eleginoides]